MIDIQFGVSGDKWAYFGYLVLLGVGFRALILALYIWPFQTLLQKVISLFPGRKSASTSAVQDSRPVGTQMVRVSVHSPS